MRAPSILLTIFEDYGIPTDSEVSCLPILSNSRRGSDLKARIRHAVSWADRRRQIRAIRDRLAQRGRMLSLEKELLLQPLFKCGEIVRVKTPASSCERLYIVDREVRDVRGAGAMLGLRVRRRRAARGRRSGAASMAMTKTRQRTASQARSLRKL